MHVYHALGKYYELMGKDEKARNLLERSMRVAVKNEMKDKEEGVEIVRKLGSIYQ